MILHKFKRSIRVSLASRDLSNLATSQVLARNHRAVLCDCCKGLSHIKCANVTPSEYKRIQDLPNKTWVCSTCITISTYNDLPFHGIGNTTLEDLFMNEPAVMDHTDLIDSQDRDFASFVDALLDGTFEYQQPSE